MFDCLDDLGVTGMHMTSSSIALMGGKMKMEFLSPQKKGLHTVYRWRGKVLWMPMDFTVEVTHWEKGKVKVWETIGPAKMIIYSWFQMQLKVKQVMEGSLAELCICYRPPNNILGRVLCFMLGDWYCRWRIMHMLRDAEKSLTASDPQRMARVVD